MAVSKLILEKNMKHFMRRIKRDNWVGKLVMYGIMDKVAYTEFWSEKHDVTFYN